MEIRNANAAGNAGGFVTIIEDFDIATMGVTKLWTLPDDLLGFNAVSVQVEFAGLTGTLDAVIELQQSNRGVTYDTVTSTVLNVANGSSVIQSTDFVGRYMSIELSKNNCTGGTVTLSVVVKVK